MRGGCDLYDCAVWVLYLCVRFFLVVVVLFYFVGVFVYAVIKKKKISNKYIFGKKRIRKKKGANITKAIILDSLNFTVLCVVSKVVFSNLMNAGVILKLLSVV